MRVTANMILERSRRFYTNNDGYNDGYDRGDDPSGYPMDRDLPQPDIRLPDPVPESVPKMPPPPSENLPPLPGQKKIKWGPINPRDVPPQKRN